MPAESDPTRGSGHARSVGPKKGSYMRSSASTSTGARKFDPGFVAAPANPPASCRSGAGPSMLVEGAAPPPPQAGPHPTTYDGPNSWSEPRSKAAACRSSSFARCPPALRAARARAGASLLRPVGTRHRVRVFLQASWTLPLLPRPAHVGPRSALGGRGPAGRSHPPMGLLASVDRAQRLPPPRFHLIRYHGVLAGRATARAEVVPGRTPADAQLPLFSRATRLPSHRRLRRAAIPGPGS